MRTVMLALMLSVAFSARAGLIDVEYWGTVDAVAGNSGPYKLGDPIHGSLRIDVSLAGPDVDPDNLPNWAWYRWVRPDSQDDPAAAPSGFVTHDGVHLDGRDSYDAVSVSNGYTPGRPDTAPFTDAFWVTDDEQLLLDSHGNSSFDYFQLVVGAAGAGDFLDDVGLLQEFDVEPTPEESRGGLSYFVDGAYAQLTFLTQRMRVRVCRP